MTQKTSLLILSLVLSIAIQPLFGEDKYPFVEKEDLTLIPRVSGVSVGYTTLTIEKTNVQFGGNFKVEVQFFNADRGKSFYNPFFQPDRYMPAQLAVYDINKKYIGNLIAERETIHTGGRPVVHAEDWIFIPTGCRVGATFLVHSFSEDGFGGNTTINALSEGDYFLQAIYFTCFTNLSPSELARFSSHDEKYFVDEFCKQFSRDELFRSNPVKITITK